MTEEASSMNSSKGKQHANYILMLKALSVEIGHFSLKDVNLSINAGDVLGVIVNVFS